MFNCIINFFWLLDFQHSDIWKEVQGFNDLQLKKLAQALPRTVLQAWAKTTTNKYAGAYQRWKEWASRHADGGFPVKVALFTLYLQHIGEDKRSRAAVSEAANAVSWVQWLAGMESVSQSPLIRAVSEGLQRSLACPKKRKEPVTPKVLREVVASFSSPPTLAEARLGNMCLLAYAAFLRIDELRQLHCCDIKFTSEGMNVNIASSKTDQYREGQLVPIASTGSLTCPVAMLHMYIDLGSIDTASELKLFRPMCASKKGESLRAKGSLSYTRIRELVLAKFKKLGYKAADITGSIVSGQEGPHQQQIARTCQRGFLSTMEGGDQRGPRMVMLKIRWQKD